VIVQPGEDVGLFEPTSSADVAELCVWGVDIAAPRVSVATDGDRQEVFSHAFEKPAARDVGERLALIHRDTRRLAVRVCALGLVPSQVSVEAPGYTSRGNEPILMFAVGAILCALRDVLEVPVWTVPVARWKLRAVGHGHASKAEALAWARRAGWRARDDNEADAAGAARACAETVWGGWADDKDLKRGAVVERERELAWSTLRGRVGKENNE
jgi:hypothetical protein